MLVLPTEAANGPLRIPVLNEVQKVEREPNDNNETANLISFPATVSGRIDNSGDVDRYAFEVKKGERYRFDMSSFENGFLLDGQLALEDSSGKELSVNDDSNKKRDPLLNWTAPADGRYCVRVRSLLDKGGMEYFYRLHFVKPEPGFTATVAAPQFAVNAGATNEVKVTVNYLDGYKGKLTVAANSLPKGVSANPVVVEKKGVVALKFVVSKDASLFSGPLSLLIGPEGAGSERKEVVCALTSSGVNNGVPQGFPEYVIPETRHLWLTILPPKKAVKKDDKPVKK